MTKGHDKEHKGQMSDREAMKLALGGKENSSKNLNKSGVTQMTKPNTIKIDDVEYVRSDLIPAPKTGARAVVVVDRGWIFAGDVTRENGRIKLSRALHVFKWEGLGFAKMVDTAKADLRPISDVDIPADSEIFSVPVEDSWGL